MALTLYYHPLASYCHKVLIALYELEVPFTPDIVDLQNPGDKDEYLEMWPIGKIPVLHDAGRERIVPETSIIIEYLDSAYPGVMRLLPEDHDTRLEVRLWDRFFDLYVQTPMQKIVLDRLRGIGAGDPAGVAEAEAQLLLAYEMIDDEMSEAGWIVGDQFSLADCAAAPALFFAQFCVPFPEEMDALAYYYERLMTRASVQRVIAEARPWFRHFPLKERMPKEWLEA